jgi:23S rRNA (cytidine1920-2'-O)/16S rRNA (cytidine1409-2'-O)-methyltransferase
LRRLDLELTQRGLARSRQDAKDLIEQGLVNVNGFVAKKADAQVSDSASITINSNSTKYVSRGARKLLSALNSTSIDFAGKICLDAGASTGGFVQVMLDRGAKLVYAVDVGYGQLAWQLQQDPRVIRMDRTNVKELTTDLLPQVPQIITADLSFISLKSVLPALDRVIDPTGEMLLMVKPQFEVGKEQVGRGVVHDPALRRDAILSVVDAARTLGWLVVGAAESAVHGPSGNREFFLHLRRNGAELAWSNISGLVTEDL